MLQYLQKIGKALMLPIAVLPIAGLLLRLGQDDVFGIPFMAAAGNAIFSNLALIFAIGIAVGLAKDHHGAAALSGAVGYFILTAGATTIDKEINMSVLGGIIAGIVAGHTYNRFKDTKLPDWLGFFSGRRLTPIMTGIIMFVAAFLFGYIWPPIQEQINHFGESIIELGTVGAGLFGFFNRLLIPLGLHHVLNTLFWFVFGEFNGVTGDLNRFFAGDPTAGVYMTGFFPIMMFGLPAAALAMIAAAKKERRKVVAGALISVAFTSFLTGITEPIEFLFLFLAPGLYVVHAALTGLSLMITNYLGIFSGFTFSAGAIDYGLNYAKATKPELLFVIGLVFGVIYFFIFYWAIKKFNIPTPGNEAEEELQDNKVVAAQDIGEVTAAYLKALGGVSNIVDLDHCATRLRVTLQDITVVDEGDIKGAGALGVVRIGANAIQIVVGTNVQFVADEIKRRL